MIKRLIAHLPARFRQELRKVWYRVHIRRGTFITNEPEFERLGEWVELGDWVIDVGANVGIYTRRLSQIVGPEGRVIALEPVPSTFELLASNTADLGNVTLIQAAAGSRNEVLRMEMPAFENGLENHYQAKVDDQGTLRVLGLTLADIKAPTPSLIKIDAEGNDALVLAGMSPSTTVPVLIVEEDSAEVSELLTRRGYRPHRMEGSPNTIWRYGPD